MGCIESKLAPESNPNGHLVKTYYDQIDRKTDKAVRGSTKNSYNSSCKRSTITFGGVTIARKPNSTDAEDEWISKKVKKYREKFDHRVTKKYDIKALIGRGSFSRVVRVEHIVSRQPYAIKMMDRYEGKEVFDTELSVLQRVKHKYIIQLVEVFETEDKLYMVMELATGGELFDRVISKGNFFESDAVRDLKMVIEGVAYLHSLGIAHRDLKPENLLYYHPGNDSRLMITDFGLSHILNGPDHFMNTTCGTPEYIAPEILARNLYSVQVDMWAIGVITYILLSGTMPFDDENRTRLYRKILRAKYTFAGQVSQLITIKWIVFSQKC